MTYKLYLDDLRTPIEDGFVVVRSAKEAKKKVLEHGVPSFISFDHDLGMDENNNLLPTGYDFAKWLVESDIDKTIQIPTDFRFKVHSQNPVGAKNIKMLLENYQNFRHKQDQNGFQQC